MAGHYRLSTQLVGHGGDVKALVTIPHGIASASRDCTVKIWQMEEDGKSYRLAGTFTRHQKYVNALAYAPSRELVLSAGQEGVIYGFSPSDVTQPPVLTLVGHTANVCTLSVGKLSDGTDVLVSGSWDMTAKIWNLSTGALISTLTGHTQAVWATLVLDNGIILTGAADKTIKMWNGPNLLRTIQGHTDCVRSLALAPGFGFVSASNDCSLRMWTLNGECLLELNGHSAYVYSVAVLASTGEVVSGSEDRSVRIWRDGECVQSISMPATSVWAVAALPNGDIAAATNDAIIRIFTREDARVADAETIQMFEEQVQQQAIPAGQVGDLKLDQIPGPEGLHAPGKKEGEVKMIRLPGDRVEAYQWTLGNWVKIGEVTNAKADKKVYNGQEWDYVFDVDLEDGAPMRKLPYNMSENPYFAAQRFIHENELSQGFLDTIAKFIIKNTGSDASTIQGQAPASDPFTGGSRYAGEPSRKYLYIPKTDFVVFDNVNPDAAITKITQINDEILSHDPASQLALSKAELDLLGQIKNVIRGSIRDAALNLDQIHVLHKLLSWPSKQRFPALDLFRALLLSQSFVNAWVDAQLAPPILTCLLQGELTSLDGHLVNQMLGCRGLVNVFHTQAGLQSLHEFAEQVTSSLLNSEHLPKDKNLRIAAASLWLNFAVLAKTAPSGVTFTAIQSLIRLLDIDNDPDVLFRSLVALGTFLLNDRSLASADIKPLVTACSNHPDQRVRGAASDVASLF